jgi:hypothetical protein
MGITMRHITGFVLVLLLAGVMAGCATTVETSAGAANTAKQPMGRADLAIYEVHHDSRIHVFYDKKVFDEFMSLGETSFRLTRIGAGPHGETMVFGLTKKDKKLKKPVAAIDLYDGKIKADYFYAEMHKHGRIYVFNRFEDMQTVRDFGHPNFMYTQVGAGPKGETLVFVLNNMNKKKQPVSLIADFNRRNS